MSTAQFNSFVRELGVETIPTDMSFGVSAARGAFEWSSHSVYSFVGSFSRLLSPSFWRLMFDVLRFCLFAEDILHEEASAPDPNECPQPMGMSIDDTREEDGDAKPLVAIGEYLRMQGYSHQFMSYFLIPMAAAPWCTDPDEFALSFPAKPLIQFM